ncbi:hypothetical protein ACFLT5_01330 [Chloroflexota bacterium]
MAKWREEMLGRLAVEWRVEEEPLHSSIPVLGPLVAAFRNAWNSVAAKWYVRHLFQQQRGFNQLVGGVLSQQVVYQLEQAVYQLEQSQRHSLLLSDREQSIAALAAQLARIELRLLRLEEMLSDSGWPGGTPESEDL